MEVPPLVPADTLGLTVGVVELSTEVLELTSLEVDSAEEIGADDVLPTIDDDGEVTVTFVSPTYPGQAATGPSLAMACNSPVSLTRFN